MLYGGSDIIRDVEWVIFDEVHYINDAEVSPRIWTLYFILYFHIYNCIRSRTHFCESCEPLVVGYSHLNLICFCFVIHELYSV